LAVLHQLQRIPQWRDEVESGLAGQLFDDALRNARAAWPTVRVTDEVFAEQLVRRLPEATTFAQALATCHAADLYLAVGCSLGMADAIAAFETMVSAEVAHTHARVRPPVPLEEARQLVLERLLVADEGAEPRMAGYRGQGSLRSWVRVAATRVLLNVAMRAPPDSPGREDELLDIAIGGDPELLYVKKRYGADLKLAFEEAARRLEPRDREALRLSVCERMNVDDMGARLGVHRATAARWLASAREALERGIRESLQSRLNVGDRDLRSMLRLVDAELHLSVSRVLGGRDP